MATEDLTTFTESDPESKIALSSTTATLSGMRAFADNRVQKSYGSGHFGDDWEHDIDVECTAIGNGNLTGFHAVTDNPDTYESLSDGIVSGYERVPDWVGRSLFMIDVGNSDIDGYGGYAVGTTYYVTVKRTGGTTAELYIYSDSDRTVSVDTLSITPDSGTYEYLMAVIGRGDSGNYSTFSGTFENYDLHEAAAMLAPLRALLGVGA